MLRIAIDGQDSTTEDTREGQAPERSANGVAATRPPTRPSSAPPSRGRRPQPNASNNEGNRQTLVPSAAASAAAGGGVRKAEEGVGVDDDSFGKDSHDLQGFDELEGEAAEAFSYDDYPAAGSPEEPEWLHTPWCGTNSGDIPVLDKVFEKAPVGGNAEKVAPLGPRMSMSVPSTLTSRGVSGKSADGGASSSFVEHSDAGGSSAKVEELTGSHTPHRESQHPDGGDVKPGVTVELSPIGRGEGEKKVAGAMSPLSLGGGKEREEGRGRGRGSPGRVSGGVSSPRVIAGGGELKRYDWGGADAAPTKPSLFATSRIPTGNRADKQKFRNAKRKQANKKVGKAGIVGPMDKRWTGELSLRSSFSTMPACRNAKQELPVHTTPPYFLVVVVFGLISPRLCALNQSSLCPYVHSTATLSMRADRVLCSMRRLFLGGRTWRFRQSLTKKTAPTTTKKATLWGVVKRRAATTRSPSILMPSPTGS